MSQDQTPDQGDLDILNYWNAAVLNYKHCHDKPEEYDTVPKITKNMMDMIPETMEAMTKVDDSKVDEQFKDVPIENVGSVKYQEEGEEEYQEEEEEEYQEEGEEEYQEEEYQYQEGDGNQQEYNDQYKNEEGVRSRFKRSNNNYSDGSKQPKKKKKEKIYPMNNEHNDYHSYHQTPPVPPPALPQTGQDEALSNLMMAWYYSGYYTGLYQAQQHRQ